MRRVLFAVAGVLMLSGCERGRLVEALREEVERRRDPAPVIPMPALPSTSTTMPPEATPPPETTPPAGWSWVRDGCVSGTFTNLGDAELVVLLQYGPRNEPLVLRSVGPGEALVVDLTTADGGALLFVDGELAELFEC